MAPVDPVAQAIRRRTPVKLGPKHNRFTDSGIAFPLACSMQQALDGMMGAGKGNVAKGREYLPDIDFTKCRTHPDELDAVFARMFAVVPPVNTFDWCGGMQCKITMGKYTSKASEDWEKFVQTSKDDAPPLARRRCSRSRNDGADTWTARWTTRGTACSG